MERAGGGRPASMETAARTHVVFEPSPVIHAHFIDEKMETREGQSIPRSHIGCQGHSQSVQHHSSQSQDPLGENTLLEGSRELGPWHFSVGP